MNDTPIIVFKNITKRVDKGRLVLKNVSFSCFAGEIVGIMGPSGSGKTTLLHIAAGLDSDFAGECLVNNFILPAQIKDMGKSKIDFLGLIFQENSLLRGLSVLENVAITGLVHSPETALKRAEYLLEKMGISDIKQKKSSVLSTGERQKTVFARALMNEPGIILADEPFANIDVESRDQLFVILKDYVVKNRGLAVIVTHDIETASKCCRILRLKHGTLIL